MSDLTPADLDLPPKFTAFYPTQTRVAYELLESEKRFDFVDAPTGTGKSIINIATARLMGARALYLVGTKGLQQQLMADFSEAGLVDIRGQSNYRCIALDGELHEFGSSGSTCDQGPCKIGVFCSMRKGGGCSYYDAQGLAKVSSLVVTNYAYWISLGRHSDPEALGEFDLLILDEAHTAPDQLTDHCAVELHEHEIGQLLGMSLPAIDDGIEVWSDWAKKASKVARDRTLQERRLLEAGGARKKHARNLLRLTDIGYGTSELARANEWRRTETPHRGVKMPGIHTDWVAEPVRDGIKFSPVWAHAYAEQFLYRGIPRVILSSATLTPQVARYLGITRNHMGWHEVESGFDPRRCPFTYVPTTRVDRNWMPGDISIWVNRIDEILDGRPDYKGIIHTRSYDRAELILSRSRHRDRLLTHTWRDARETIARFKHSRDPLVLVSPSVEEGFDFPDDQCRFQIIAKVPFEDGRNPIYKARRQSDKSYPNYVTALAITQQAGRGMRHRNDWCETFIIDDHWKWFRNAGRFPQWFKRCWRRRDEVPPALRFAA